MIARDCEVKFAVWNGFTAYKSIYCDPHGNLARRLRGCRNSRMAGSEVLLSER